MLVGLTAGTYLGEGSRRASSQTGRTAFATFMSVFAVGCPICNKLVVALLGAQWGPRSGCWRSGARYGCVRARHVRYPHASCDPSISSLFAAKIVDVAFSVPGWPVAVAGPAGRCTGGRRGVWIGPRGYFLHCVGGGPSAEQRPCAQAAPIRVSPDPKRHALPGPTASAHAPDHNDNEPRRRASHNLAMSLIGLREALRRRRRSLAVIAVMLTLGTTLAVHHGLPSAMGAMPAHAVCLAVMAIAGVAVAAVGLLVGRRRLPWLELIGPPMHSLISASARAIPARAGPLGLQVLRL